MYKQSGGKAENGNDHCSHDGNSSQNHGGAVCAADHRKEAAHDHQIIQMGIEQEFCPGVCIAAADQITHRHTDGDSAMAVAEIPVVVHLEPCAH